MFRYKFTKKNIEQAKKYIREGTGPQPSFLKKYKGTIDKKKKTLLLDEYTVVPREAVNSVLRKWVLGGTVPMTRDGLYYYIQTQKIVGIPRQMIDDFLKKQRIIVATDNDQPSTKKKGRSVHKKGILAFDLVEINWKDLGFKPKDMKIKQVKKDKKKSNTDGYIFTMADSLTGMIFAEVVNSKKRTDVTPIAKKGFQFFSQKLSVPMDKMFASSDSGNEFDFELYKSWGIRLKQLPRSALIENKNAQFQRALYRLVKLNNTNRLKVLVKNAMNVVNKTQSSLTKKTPNEAANNINSELSEKYNKKRGKDSGVKIKARPLKKGELVRINLIGPKKDSFYKAYKGKTWSKKLYNILGKRGNTYLVNGPKGKKYYHRDAVRLSTQPDMKSEKILKERGAILKSERDAIAKKEEAIKNAKLAEKKKVVKSTILKKKIKKKIHNKQIKRSVMPK